MKRLDLQRLVPPGVNAQQELTWMLVGWIFSAFYSLCFVYMYQTRSRVRAFWTKMPSCRTS